MSLPPQSPYPVPAETRRVARAAFPKGTLCLHLAEALGPIYHDTQFSPLFATRGQPGLSPARLGLISVLQFVEGLSDRQAAEAVRRRMDWKYALGLELTDPGFDFSVLSEFRGRRLEGGAESLRLDALLTQLQEIGVLRKRGRQRTDSTHVLAAVRVLNRLERVGETLRAALNAWAVVAPEWLQALAPAEWYERYGERVENYHLPKTDRERDELASVIAADGQFLLSTIDAETEQSWLREIPAVKTWRRVWAEQYVEREGHLFFRPVKEMPSPAGVLTSPYETEARYSTKSGLSWIGYKVHLTETCDEDQPNLIVKVETTPATTPDDNRLSVVHESLQKRDLLPAEHLVDAGYTDARLLVETEQQYGVTIVGPVIEDHSWQAKAGAGFARAQFVVDWEQRQVTCPAGKQSISWLPHTYPASGWQGEARFSARDCTPGAFRPQCARRKSEPRILGLQNQAEYEALERMRQHQRTAEFRQQYAARAGIEGTHEQAIRRCGLRQCRYGGMAQTHLQHLLTAAAINLVRMAKWWAGRAPAQTRRSAFRKLQPQAA